jgi:hypothetical protein
MSFCRAAHALSDGIFRFLIRWSVLEKTCPKSKSWKKFEVFCRHCISSSLGAHSSALGPAGVEAIIKRRFEKRIRSTAQMCINYQADIDVWLLRSDSSVFILLSLYNSWRGSVHACSSRAILFNVGSAFTNVATLIRAEERTRLRILLRSLRNDTCVLQQSPNTYFVNIWSFWFSRNGRNTVYRKLEHDNRSKIDVCYKIFFFKIRIFTQFRCAKLLFLW